MLINLRNALMGGKRLPYDAEVEYLESTGTQWINTGVVSSGIDIKCLMAFTDNTVANQGVFGSRVNSGDTGSNAYQIWYNVSANSLRLDWASYTKSATVSLNTPVSIEAYQNGSVYVNGTQYTGSAKTANIYDFFIFNFNQHGSTGATGCRAKLYSFKIYQNGTLVRDFIPVRKGAVGYLYDRVSGKLFGNAGTGDFVVGQDVVPVEWLESNGNQYIDTGVKPDATYTFDSTVAVMRSNYNCVYWGCRSSGTYTSDNSQCYLTNNTSSTAGEKFRQIRLLSTDANSNTNWNSGIVPQTSVFYQLSGMSTVSTMNTMTYPIILFGLNNIGQKVTNVGCVRIAKWTAYKSGARANNFLPIRVGTEGAMMDVLTRRVYRNAGTGAFTYGNDLKYPIPAS